MKETTDTPATKAWLTRPRWKRFTLMQLVVMGLAAIAPIAIIGSLGAAAIGLISSDTMVQTALVFGEDPGMITFGAMFLATPVQKLTGRSQVRVRKYLGIVFFILAVSNFVVMFLIPETLAAAFAEPFLIAGVVALVVALPLFLTSSRWAQRNMGMRRWRLLHKLTYVVAAALLAHMALLGEAGPGAVLIALGFVARIPLVSRWLESRSHRSARREPALDRLPLVTGGL